MVGFESTDGLMRHLRDKGISISDDEHRQQLINTGYYHGYKGYRFFNNSQNKIDFTKYDEIYATIKYDSDIKALLYGKVMFIETAVKNIALNRILIDADSESIQDMYEKVISGFKNMPRNSNLDEKKKAQKNKLKLKSNIQQALSTAYDQHNHIIEHFYNNTGYSDVPLWALFEILTLGNFAYLLSCLTFDTREHITSDLGMRAASVDTNRELIYKYLFALKDLRNAIAHNSVVFDTRFRKFDPSSAMKSYLKFEFGLPYVNFKTIGDYLILICYYLKLFKVSKTEIKTFIEEFERITNDYKGSVSSSVSSKVIHPDLSSRLNLVKTSIN